MSTVIHHNPDCGTSRNVLAILQAAGADPTVILYRETGWTRAHLLTLFAAAGVTPRQALRSSGTQAGALGLTAPDISDDALIAAMINDPVLVNRPFVATPKGIALCRPSASVLDLLDHWPTGPFALEDGTVLIDENGARV